MIISAPAKVNLYLKVLNTRPDGYHNITTVFERINLVDRIHIKKTQKGICLSSSVPITQNQEENLAYKAAKAILDFVGSDQGLEIHIDKNIPIAAGLGGGSSDAASVLAGVNKLLALKVGRRTLRLIAKGLGADVPFFLSGSKFAIGTARGDSLKSIHSRKTFYHIIIYPNFRLLTKHVYERFDALSQKGSDPYKGVRPLYSRNLTKLGRGVQIGAV